MTQREEAHMRNITVLKELIQIYGFNRSLGNVLDNENAKLKAIRK